MTVLTFATNDLFVVRVKKSHTANPSRSWQNSYEFVAGSSGVLSDLEDLAGVVLDFEQQIHNTFTQFEQVSVSTWTADSVPYDPDAFLVVPTDLQGTRDTTGALADIVTCWNVSRPCLSGRTGHIFYRNVFAQSDLTAPSGISVLADPSTFTTLLSTALSSSTLGNYVGLIVTLPLQMALINKTGSNVRGVQTLVSSGVSKLPVDHAWFNRTTP
jgi:hypothetical protein